MIVAIWTARVGVAGALTGLVLGAASPTWGQSRPIDPVTSAEAPAAPPGNPHAPTPGNVVQPIRPRAPDVAAKSLFGAATAPAPMAARAIGNYSRGCLAGARQLAVDGPAWQAMRLSRNRNWGHPNLVSLVEKLAVEARAKDGWSGLMVGDMSQPRGGPMLTGHASHQIGLDADIWFTPMPDRRLTSKEREDVSAVSMLQPGDLAVDNKAFTAAHVRILKRTASYPDVERVLVHPAIKKAICEATAQDSDRAWLAKVRPIWGHYYHFHIRIGCPAGSTGCMAQKGIPGDDGCGKELADWYKLLTAPPGSTAPEAPKPPLTLEQLPTECRVVLQSGR